MSGLSKQNHALLDAAKEGDRLALRGLEAFGPAAFDALDRLLDAAREDGRRAAAMSDENAPNSLDHCLDIWWEDFRALHETLDPADIAIRSFRAGWRWCAMMPVERLPEEVNWPALAGLRLDSIAALLAAERTLLTKRDGERDTEFVKRITAAYINAAADLERESVA